MRIPNDPNDVGPEIFNPTPMSELSTSLDYEVAHYHLAQLEWAFNDLLDGAEVLHHGPRTPVASQISNVLWGLLVTFCHSGSLGRCFSMRTFRSRFAGVHA